MKYLEFVIKLYVSEEFTEYEIDMIKTFDNNFTNNIFIDTYNRMGSTISIPYLELIRTSQYFFLFLTWSQLNEEKIDKYIFPNILKEFIVQFRDINLICITTNINQLQRDDFTQRYHMSVYDAYYSEYVSLSSLKKDFLSKAHL